jgi:hypothetical protein
MAKTTTTATTANTNSIPSWNTIHIFGYGETQVIGNDKLNKKFSTKDLTKVQAVVDYLFTTKPEENNATKEYHTINIFNNGHVDFVPKDSNSKGWRVKFEDLVLTTINALAQELLDKKVIEPTPVVEA